MCFVAIKASVVLLFYLFGEDIQCLAALHISMLIGDVFIREIPIIGCVLG